MKNNYTKVLEECIKIANERQEQYGKADESIQICSNLLRDIFKIDLSVSQIAKVLVCLKLSREANAHKEDNLLDIINYLAISLHSNTKKNVNKNN